MPACCDIPVEYFNDIIAKYEVAHPFIEEEAAINTIRTGKVFNSENLTIRVDYSQTGTVASGSSGALVTYNNVYAKWNYGELASEEMPFALLVSKEILCGQSNPTKLSADEFNKAFPGQKGKLPKESDNDPTKTQMSIRQYPHLRKDAKPTADSKQSLCFIAVKYINQYIHGDLSRRLDAGFKLLEQLKTAKTFADIDAWFTGVYKSPITKLPLWIIVSSNQFKQSKLMSPEDFKKVGEYITRVGNSGLTDFIQDTALVPGTATKEKHSIDNPIYRIGVVFNNKSRPGGFRNTGEEILDEDSPNETGGYEIFKLDGEEINLHNSWKLFRSGTTICSASVRFSIYHSNLGVGVKSETGACVLRKAAPRDDAQSTVLNMTKMLKTVHAQFGTKGAPNVAAAMEAEASYDSSALASPSSFASSTPVASSSDITQASVLPE
jgi:hypothetical protein